MRLLTAFSLVVLYLQPYIHPSDADSPPPPVILPPDNCNCNRYYILPVCSNNSFTYGNECQLYCESKARVQRGQSPIFVKSTGICPNEGCSCPPVTFPVCGTDGNTYENECRLECYSNRQVRLGLNPIYIKSQGICTSTCNCPIDIIASCGSNGVTYSSHCLIQCENVIREHFGLPPILRTPGACPVQCLCSQNYLPVCGTDGKTYYNECQLKCESDRQQRLGRPAIKVKSQGKCPSVQCICPLNVLPVCGTNGITYSNECELDCASKNQQIHGGPPIYLAYKGSCISPPCQCPSIIEPVCGTDKRTYKNVCYLNCASFTNIRNGFPAVYLSKIGPC